MRQQPPHSVMATLRNASEPLGMRKRDVFVSSRINVTQTRSFKLFFGPSLGDESSLPGLHNNQLEGGPSGELNREGGFMEKLRGSRSCFGSPHLDGHSVFSGSDRLKEKKKRHGRDFFCFCSDVMPFSRRMPVTDAKQSQDVF